MPSSEQIMKIFRLTKGTTIGKRFHIIDISVEETIIKKYIQYKHKIVLVVNANNENDIIDISNDIISRRGPRASIAIVNCYLSEIDINSLKYFKIDEGSYKNHHALYFETISNKVNKSNCH